MKTDTQFWSYVALLYLQWEKLQAKFCRDNQTQFLFWKIFFLILHRRTGLKWKYGACVLHAGYLKLQTHTEDV
jgi:hypothetical protein